MEIKIWSTGLRRGRSLCLYIHITLVDFEGIVFSGVEIWGKLKPAIIVSVFDIFLLLYELQDGGDAVASKLTLVDRCCRDTGQVLYRQPEEGIICGYIT